jgi:hypothetical protein
MGPSGEKYDRAYYIMSVPIESSENTPHRHFSTQLTGERQIFAENAASPMTTARVVTTIDGQDIASLVLPMNYLRAKRAKP